MKMFKKILLVGCITLPLLFAGCDDDNSGGSSSNAIGCANLKAGTTCSETAACSKHFLCLTGQGSDKNCSDGCSCQ